jgi:hypothetical protein
VPEALFDMDFAGHYYRRIKSVRITIPCVVGPYTNVSATLRLTSSWTRRSADLADAEQPTQDGVAPAQAAIATSSANQEGGVFELTFSDPRYLPFEGAGAISSWQLDLPSTIRPFDYATIADVVMHVSYTARDGGPQFKATVNAGLLDALNDMQPLMRSGATLSRLFSLRYDYPDAWSQLISAADAPTRSVTLQVSKALFPAFLDYAWQPASDGASMPQPITLDVQRFTAYLSPRGPASADAMTLNQQPATDLGLGLPAFDLTGAPGALSHTQIGAGEIIDCMLTIAGSFRMEDWHDLYLLMDYRALT